MGKVLKGVLPVLYRELGFYTKKRFEPLLYIYSQT